MDRGADTAEEFFKLATPRRLRSCRHDGSPRNSRHTPAENWTTAPGRFPGFRVDAFAHLPDPICGSVVLRTKARRLQLRGQPRSYTAFPTP